MNIDYFGTRPPYGKWYNEAKDLGVLTKEMRDEAMLHLASPLLMQFFRGLCEDMMRNGLYLPFDKQDAARGALSVIDEIMQKSRNFMHEKEKETQ